MFYEGSETSFVKFMPKIRSVPCTSIEPKRKIITKNILDDKDKPSKKRNLTSLYDQFTLCVVDSVSEGACYQRKKMKLSHDTEKQYQQPQNATIPPKQQDDKQTCIVSGCTGKILCEMLCKAHYGRLYNQKLRSNSCVNGCDKPVKRKGRCYKCYDRYLKEKKATG